MMRSRIARVSALFCLFALLGSLPAHAQSTADLKRARAQFQRGIELEQASNWTEAIQVFRDVGQVRMTPQVRFHIAFCEEGLGRLVTALGGYDLALSEADSVGADFKSEVETAMGGLRDRIPKLYIERGSGADAALVQLDGIDLGASQIGVEVPLDPGPHKVTAAAPGYKSFDATVALKEREVTRVTLDLEPAPEAVDKPPPTRVVIVPPPPDGPSRTVPYIVGGAGIGFLMGAGALFALRQSTLADLENDCPNPNACPKSNQDSYDRAKLYGVLAPIAAGVGVAAVGTAIVLIVTEKKPAAPKKPAGKSAVELDRRASRVSTAFLRLTITPSAPDSLVGTSVLGRF